MLDDRMDTRSGRAGAPLWGPSANQFGWRSYLSGLGRQDDVPGYAAPARAADLAGLPATFITVGNLDGLLDEDVDSFVRDSPGQPVSPNRYLNVLVAPKPASAGVSDGEPEHDPGPFVGGSARPYRDPAG
jgi:acetyl esterase/lipase